LFKSNLFGKKMKIDVALSATKMGQLPAPRQSKTGEKQIRKGEISNLNRCLILKDVSI
jgi:hypothetical protein